MLRRCAWIITLSSPSKTHQAVGDEFVIGLESAGSGNGRVLLCVSQKAEVRDPRGISSLRFAHPDPQGAVPFHEAIGSYACHLWNRAISVRTVDAYSGPVETKPVIAALDNIAAQAAPAETAHAEGSEAVGTPIGECCRHPVFPPEHQYRFVQKLPRQQRSSNLTAACGDVPAFLRNGIRPICYGSLCNATRVNGPKLNCHGVAAKAGAIQEDQVAWADGKGQRGSERGRFASFAPASTLNGPE